MNKPQASAASYLDRSRSGSDSLPLLITPQIVAVTAVAAILRVFLLRQPYMDAFSWRQSSTAMIADNFYRKGWNIFYPEVNWSGPGPSYQGREFQTVSYLAALLYKVVGQHDWVGRAVAVAFGIVGVFSLYQLVRNVWDEERATLSAAVMAVLPGSIFIERSFLPDAAMVALVTTSFWLLVLYLKTERLPYLLLAGVVGAWGFSTKIPGIIVGLPMAYAVISTARKTRPIRKSWIIAIVLFGLLTLVPVVAYYLWARHLALSFPPYHFAGAGNWLWNDGVKAWWGQKFFLSLLAQRFYDWNWTLPMIILVALGLILRPRKPSASPEPTDSKQPSPHAVRLDWLFHWWLLAGVIYYLIGAKELVTNPWNFHIINPAAAALAAQAIFQLANMAGRAVHHLAKPAVITLLVALIFFVGQQGLIYMYNPYAEEGYQLGIGLQQVAEPETLVVTIANDPGDPVAIFYSGRRGWVFPPPLPGEAWGVIPEDSESVRLFEELRAEGASWFGIVRSQKKELATRHPQFIEYIERTCELKLADPAYDIYRIRNPGEVAKLPALK